ncbi:MAG TPA: ABC transporter ATP-binding protein [Anaerolineales bacterium]|nr:ABC transporter ATP-binding protein [Anaerolineales bacterium]HRQ91828.1 ABC transporter ATP-binding protein [Anaerolineales bacterium]
MLTIDTLTYVYKAGLSPAVNNLSFQVKPGEIFGFLGPSGAGKSTTQKILIGLLKDFSGSVSVLGRDISTWGSELYERIGVAFEVPNLYLKLSGLENLHYFGALYEGAKRDPQELLTLVNLSADGHMLTSQYSKGMRHRLNIARSLLHNPELLFMDEPTAGLDPVNARRIKDLLLEQRAAGKTVFLTTHDMAIADELCDRVAFIVDGQIALIDSPRALKLKYGTPNLRVEYVLDDRTATQEFKMKGLGDQAQFLSLLRSGTVQTMHTTEATLESIFIEVTGRGLA